MKTTKRKRDTTSTSGKAKAPASRAKAAQARPALVAAPIVATAPAVEASSAPEQVATPSPAPVSISENAIVLAGVCTVREAAALKESLSRLLDKDAVAIDASNVERVDTAAMQLLCAFVRDRAQASRKVTWSGDSAALRDAARLLGVSEMLALAPGAGA